MDSRAKKVSISKTSVADLGSVPFELIGNFDLVFYQNSENAVFKVLWVE